MKDLYDNIIKGWITSMVGLCIWLGVIAHWTGYLKFPNPEFLSNTAENVIAIIVGIAFFRIPYSKMEYSIELLWDSIVGLFKRKADQQ
jgi:hypothetical protein